MVVREVQAKSILNASKIDDYCVNPYTGCACGCAYCYARLFIPRYSGHAEPWGTFVDVKVNAPDLLRKRLGRAKPGTVWVASVCDPYQPLERTYRVTRRCLEELVRWPLPLRVQTKSALAARDLDLFVRFKEMELGFTITTEDERVAAVLEPGASPVADRIAALGEIHGRGIPTYAFIGPIAPGDPERLVERLAGKVDRVMLDRLNYVPQYRAFYKAHGLESGLEDAFFAAMKKRFTAALKKKGIPFDIFF